MDSTADTPPNIVSAWFQSLPQSFPSSSEGFVEELIALCQVLFIEVQHTVGEREGSNNLLGLQQDFAIWIDQKDRLDERLNRAPDLRTQIVCNLVALIVVLSKGLPPSHQRARFPETRRVIEQASAFASNVIDQSRHYVCTHPAEYIHAASNAIQSRLGNLRDLSPTIDGLSLERYDEAESGDAREGSAVTREGIPPAFRLFFEGKFPDAPDSQISRCFAANCLRANGFRSSHPEVDVYHDSSNGTDDGEASPSNSSKPRTGPSSDSSTSFFNSSMASRFLSKTKAPSGSAPTSLSTEANLFSIGQTGSSDSRARRTLECPLCNEKAKDPADYKKHMLLHIPPYHCCFEDCDDVLPLFSNLQQWFDHEFQNHRVYIRWNCRYEDCQSAFDRPNPYLDHLSQAHGKQPVHEPEDKILEASRVRLPRPVQDELCVFCSQGSFKSRDDYETHVGEHMEEIASLVIPNLIPAARRRLLDMPAYARKVFQFCGRVSQLARRPSNFLRTQTWSSRARTDEDFDFRLLIWDQLQQQDFSHWAFVDTGVYENFILSSVAKERSIEPRLLPHDEEPWKTLNGHEVFAKEYVVPEWRRYGAKNSRAYKNIRFILVDEIPEPGVEVILGRRFINERKIIRVNKSLFILHRNKPRTGREEHQQDSQNRDNHLRETERKAAIKTQRDVSQAASSQVTQTAKSGYQPSQKDTAKAGDPERR